jgi:hypothetical protein
VGSCRGTVDALDACGPCCAAEAEDAAESAKIPTPSPPTTSRRDLRSLPDGWRACATERRWRDRREAENLRSSFGSVFPALPKSLLESSVESDGRGPKKHNSMTPLDKLSGADGNRTLLFGNLQLGDRPALFVQVFEFPSLPARPSLLLPPPDSARVRPGRGKVGARPGTEQPIGLSKSLTTGTSSKPTPCPRAGSALPGLQLVAKRDDGARGGMGFLTAYLEIARRRGRQFALTGGRFDGTEARRARSSASDLKRPSRSSSTSTALLAELRREPRGIESLENLPSHSPSVGTRGDAPHSGRARLKRPWPPSGSRKLAGRHARRRPQSMQRDGSS